MRVGFVGTGTMGNLMVCCLLEAGHQVTVHDLRREATTTLCERGIGILDAPVSGRPPDMTIMAGGDATTFGTYQPLLACMGRNIFHVGETGAGCIAKLVTQYLGYVNFVTALEGLLIVAKDLHLACELAREVGAPAHTGVIADDVFRRAQAQGWGQRGFPIAARIVEAMAGIELRAP